MLIFSILDTAFDTSIFKKYEIENTVYNGVYNAVYNDVGVQNERF